MKMYPNAQNRSRAPCLGRHALDLKQLHRAPPLVGDWPLLRRKLILAI